MTIVTTYDPDGAATVTLAGRVDVLDAPALRETLALAANPSSPTIVVDLTAVQFMDSAILAALVRARTDCQAAGGDVILVPPHATAARRILSLTHFDQIFTIDASKG